MSSPAYIFITEDQTIFHCFREPTQEELDQCDNGVLTIIDTKNMTAYDDGDWFTIFDWDSPAYRA